MEPEPLDVTLATQDDVCIVTVTGEIDMVSAPDVIAAFAPHEATRLRRWVVDITGVSFIDSTGLSAFVKAHRELERQGVEFRLVVGPSSAAHRALEITGLLDELNVVSSVEEALT
jgi:anti-sigma B factor antagonist